MKNTKLSNLSLKFHQEKLYFLTQFYIKTKIATSKQVFLQAKPEHPRSLKSSIPYNQALRLKSICSTTKEFDKNCVIIKQKFLDRQYKEEVLDEQIRNVDRIERKELFARKGKNNKKRTPLSRTYNRTLLTCLKL